MASTYSALKIELLETGANSGTWGTATNVNLGDAILGEAITGSATVDFSSNADVTITLTDVSTTQAARNLRLNITESGGGVGSVRNLILGSGCQIEKFYLIRNNGTGAKTIKNTTGTGILVPAGTTTLVYNDGTNVVDAVNSFSSAITGAELTGSVIPFYFGSTLPTAGQANHGAVAHLHSTGKLYYSHGSAWQIITSGLGTASTTGAVTPVGSAGQLLTNDGAGGLTSNTTGTGVVTALAVNVGSAGAPVVNGGALGTPSSGTATNLTGLPLSTGVTGTLPVANGGTGLTTTPANGALDIGNGTGFTRTTLTAGTNVTITNAAGAITIAASGGGAAATPTALGTVYGKQTTSGGTPFLTAYGYNAGVATTGVGVTAVGVGALASNVAGAQHTAVGYQALNAQASATSAGSTAFGYQAGLNYNNADAVGSSVFVGFWAGKTTSTGTDNTFVGGSAGQLNTTGGYNSGLGGASLQLNTTGSYNTSLGMQALRSNTTASNNTAVGNQASYANTSGAQNVAVGGQSLYNNTTGSTNLAVGYQAGYGLRTSGTAPTNNIAIGNETLYTASYASGHIAIGYQALRAAGDNGGNTVAIGYQAGKNCATPSTSVFIGNGAAFTNTYWIGGTCVGPVAGYSYNDPLTAYPGNCFIGDGSGYSCTTGTGNVIVGAGEQGFSSGSGRAITSGAQNSICGAGALRTVTTTSNSTAMGYAVLSNSTGAENTGLGAYAGAYNFGSGVATTTGTRNVFLGAYSIANAAADSNCIVIGATIIGKGANTGFISPNGGGVYQGNNSSAWSTTSDRRLKKNIVDNNVGLDAITAIRVRNFEYRLPEEVDAELKPTDAIIKSGVQLGVIAQELQAVLPNCVKQETSGVMSVDPDNLTWYMINAIKELNAKIEAQAAEIAILKGQA